MKIKIPHVQVKLSLREIHVLEFFLFMLIFIVFVRLGLFRIILNIMDYYITLL